MNRKITFITIGDITSIATMKRALGMANPLSELGWSVSIIAMDCEENRKRISLECNDAIKIFFYKEGSVKNEVAQKTELIREIKPEYVYFCSFSARNRIDKRKISYRGKIIVEHSELSSSIKVKTKTRRFLDYTVERYSVLYADMLVCASKYLVSYYRNTSRWLLKKSIPIDYSPYAFNEDIINAYPVIFDELKARYSGKSVFLYMGTMTRNYGLFTMLQAAEILKNNTDDKFVLLMLGDGPDIKEAKKYIEEKELSDVVAFTGYTPESHLSSYFKLTNAFISPINNTVQDIARCPSKIYMYLPFHKPVFTCKLGEPWEIFRENGYYFDNNDPLTLANLMEDGMVNNFTESQVNVSAHSWVQRSIDFDQWIKSLKGE